MDVPASSALESGQHRSTREGDHPFRLADEPFQRQSDSTRVKEAAAAKEGRANVLDSLILPDWPLMLISCHIKLFN